MQTIEFTQVKEVHTGTPSTDVQTQKPNKPTEKRVIETDMINKPDINVNRSDRQELNRVDNPQVSGIFLPFTITDCKFINQSNSIMKHLHRTNYM